MDTEANAPIIKSTKISRDKKSKSQEEATITEFDQRIGLHLKARKVTCIRYMKTPQGHWYIECDAYTPLQMQDRKIIKIDSVKKSYQVLYNAEPKGSDDVLATYDVIGGHLTIEDVMEIVVQIVSERGKWHKNFNCEAFAEEFLMLLRLDTRVVKRN